MQEGPAEGGDAASEPCQGPSCCPRVRISRRGSVCRSIRWKGLLFVPGPARWVPHSTGWTLPAPWAQAKHSLLCHLKYLPSEKSSSSDIRYLRYQSSRISPILEIGHLRYLLLETSALGEKLNLSEILFN